MDVKEVTSTEADGASAVGLPPMGAPAKFASGLVWIAAAAALIVAVLGTADALSTLIRNRPLAGVLEVTELSLVVIVCMSQPFIVLTGAHITLDLITPRTGSPLYWLRLVLTLAAALLFYGLIAWTAWDAFLQSWDVRQVTDGVVRLPVYPVKLLLVIGMAAAALMVPVLLYQKFLRLRAGRAGKVVS